MRRNKNLSEIRIKFALIVLFAGIGMNFTSLPASAHDLLDPESAAPAATAVAPVDSLQQSAADSCGIVIAEDDLIIESEPTGIKVTDIITETSPAPPEAPVLADNPMGVDTLFTITGRPHSIYGRPASWTYSEPWWHGLWINTAVYAGAFCGTLFVLECLPEDATSWNRAELQKDPFYKRWYENVFKKGPAWDKDNPIFNFVLHPYAGAAYFMSARTCGFNFWQSLLYSACISTIGWEFGIEACMERPSYQDLFITPLVGSIMGEGFYRLKRLIVNRDYNVLGSKVIGHILAFFLDPVNEIVGWLSPKHECRYIGPGCLQSQPMLIPSPGTAGQGVGFSISATF